MKNQSVFYTVTLIFTLATISIFLAFLWLMDYDKQNYTRELNIKYSVISRATLLHMSGLVSDMEYKKQVDSFKMPKVLSTLKKYEILANASTIQEISSNIGVSAILLYKRHHFLKIRHQDELLLLEDNDFQPYRYDIIKVIFCLVFLIILISYIFIIRKIKPLRKLKKQIDKFASGDLEIQNVSTGQDEISEVAEAFYNSIMQIKAMSASRQLFLRNIMHELKTPITKGRITVEMIEPGKNKERLISVFERLESLINEFATVERATSKIAATSLTNCHLSDLIDEAIDIAMIEKNQIKFEHNADLVVNVDFKLFCIAIKNILDNGIKYSNDRSVCIKILPNSVDFITSGDKLENELKFFIEPFNKGKNAKQSFGLGLYIVDNILKAHKMRLGYEFKDGLNIFRFELLENILV